MDFRNYCNSSKLPMNIVVEAFMEQFADGQFSLKLVKNKNNKLELDIED